MRVHGDYHLGQVLRSEEDFVILDFEGEPARSIEERRRKHSPARDVAGMLRSFSYAAYAALFSFTRRAHGDERALEPWADTWQERVSTVFVDTYLATIGPELVPDAAAWRALVHAFTLDKALYELAYEINHRPDWVGIPLAGIRKLLEPPAQGGRSPVDRK
jgi:maltose alpha-D-glucosyltransferase/alpha-amylase